MFDHKTYRNIVIQPILGMPTPAPPGMIPVGGPIYPDFNNQGKSRHLRLSKPADICPPMPSESAITSLDEEFVYGGYAYAHFGHFTAEFIHRILPSILAYPTLRVIFVSNPAVVPDKRPKFISEIFDYFGISGRVFIVDKPVRVSCLHVFPQQEHLGGGVPEAAYLDALGDQQQKKLTPIVASGHGILFVSRAKQHSRMAAESLLEDLFAKLGATIFRPEEYSLVQQLSHYVSYRRIIFSEGSALHGLQLLGRLQAEVTILRRHGGFKDSPDFLMSRVAKLNRVSLEDGMVHGYGKHGYAVYGTGLFFINASKLQGFCKDYFYETDPIELHAVLEAATKRLRAVEHEACTHLLRYRHLSFDGDWKDSARIIRQISSLNRFGFREILNCMSALYREPDQDRERNVPAECNQTLDWTDLSCSDDALSWLAMMADLEAGVVDPACCVGVDKYNKLLWQRSNSAALRLMFALAEPGAGRLMAVFKKPSHMLDINDLDLNMGLFLRAVFLRAALPECFGYRLGHLKIEPVWLEKLRQAKIPLWRKLVVCLFIFLPGIELGEGGVIFLERHIRWLREVAERGDMNNALQNLLLDPSSFERQVGELGQKIVWDWQDPVDLVQEKYSQSLIQELGWLCQASPRDYRISLALSRAYAGRRSYLPALFFATLAWLSTKTPEADIHLARILMLADEQLALAQVLLRHLGQTQPNDKDHKALLLEIAARKKRLERPPAARPCRPEMLPREVVGSLENFADSLGSNWFDAGSRRLRLDFQGVLLFHEAPVVALFLTDTTGRFEIPLPGILWGDSPRVGKIHPEVSWSSNSRFIVDEMVSLPVGVEALDIWARFADGTGRDVGRLRIG